MKSLLKRESWLVVLLLSACYAAAALGAEAPAAATNAIPKSVFARDPAGRDPFEPNREDVPWGGDKPVQTRNVCDTIRITGVVGSGAARLVTVQGVPMRTGEKTELKGMDGQRLEWKVVEILEKEVVMQTGGTVCTIPIQSRVLPPVTGSESKGK
jgi:hypothetical protein